MQKSADSEGNSALQELQNYDVLDRIMPGVTTGALLEAMESPEIFAEVARGDLYVQMARMRALLPTLSPTQQLDYTKFLAKLGKVDAPDREQASALSRVPMIHIDLGGGNRLSIGAAPERDVTPALEDE